MDYIDHFFGYWIGRASQQVNAWSDVDPELCRHMASLENDEHNPCASEF